MHNIVSTWYGVPIDELEKEELINCINFLSAEIKRLEIERNRWRDAGDPIEYLKQSENQRMW